MRSVKARPIGPLKEWICTVKMLDGTRYGITLMAADPDTIEANWPWITVEGELLETLIE